MHEKYLVSTFSLTISPELATVCPRLCFGNKLVNFLPRLSIVLTEILESNASQRWQRTLSRIKGLVIIFQCLRLCCVCMAAAVCK